MDNLKILAPEDYLMHYGIEGQKWGIRRYQNPDGSLTAAGRQRYGYSGKRYGERYAKFKAVGLSDKQSTKLAALKTKSHDKGWRIGRGVYSGLQGASAVAKAATVASTVSKLKAMGYTVSLNHAILGLSIGAPVAIAAATVGYSLYRKNKNKKLYADMQKDLDNINGVKKATGPSKTTQMKKNNTSQQRSKPVSTQLKAKSSTTEKVPNNGHDMKSARSITNISQIPKSSKPKMYSNGEVSWLTSDGHIAYGEYDKKTGKIYGVSVNG